MDDEMTSEVSRQAVWSGVSRRFPPAENTNRFNFSTPQTTSTPNRRSHIPMLTSTSLPLVPEKRHMSSVSPSDVAARSLPRPRAGQIAMHGQPEETIPQSQEQEEDKSEMQELQLPQAPSHDESHDHGAMQFLRGCDFQHEGSGRVPAAQLAPGVMAALSRRLAAWKSANLLANCQKPVKSQSGTCLFYRAKVPRATHSRDYTKPPGSVQCVHCQKHGFPCIMKKPDGRPLLLPRARPDRKDATPD